MEDSQIIQLYWDRDESAIPATSEKYGNYCTAIAKNITGSLEDAEECVNDTWLSAWNSIPPHRPVVLVAYLGRITRNLSLNRYRRNTAEKRSGGEMSTVFDELEECVSGRYDPTERVETQELMDTINHFLETLPEEKRNIFVLRYWYAESIADIAARLGKKEGAVSMTLSRMRAQLRQYLLEGGHTL